MSRREHRTILVETLMEIERAQGEDEASLSRLAARCNVPYDRFQVLVAELQARNLVSRTRPYAPTSTGVELLSRYRSWLEMLHASDVQDEAPLTPREHGP